VFRVAVWIEGVDALCVPYRSSLSRCSRWTIPCARSSLWKGVWFSARQVFCNRRKTAVRREVWLVRNDDVSCSLGNSHLIMCLCPQGTERGILAVVRLFAINFTWCEKNVENMWLVCYGGRRSMELMDQLDERFDEALASSSRFEVGHVA